jgi:membrane protein DedA with SNARE-associated domain
MWSWLHICIGLVAHNPEWALTIAFAGAFIEAVALFGILVPGTPILMAVTGAAAMAGQAMLPFLVVAIIGAIMGDFASYWMGHHYSARLRTLWPFSRRPHLMAKADRFFHRYGTASVALCRFVPVLRSTVPLVAGMTGMSRHRFLLANVTSALIWAPAHVYPAQFAGLSIERLEQGDWQTAALWAGALLTCCAGGWLLHRMVVAHVR